MCHCRECEYDGPEPLCCLYCGNAADADICADCQRSIEDETDDTERKQTCGS